jgi:putative ABC transport system ATP-binding protein
VNKDQQSPLICLEGIGKTFHTDDIETHSLDDISFNIAKGDYVSISGPSGCGKSTLLSILGLLDTPTTGCYRLAGHDVSDLESSERARIRNREIGFVFQSFNLIADLNVIENVGLPLTFRDGVPKADRDLRAREALERVDMGHRLGHYPGQLSGGQQQRVAVARALVGSPTLLLADEPTGNLDSRSGEAVMGLLERLNADGTTICIVTHDPRYAEYAKRRISLFDGRQVDEDTLVQIRREEDARAMER